MVVGNRKNISGGRQQEQTVIYVRKGLQGSLTRKYVDESILLFIERLVCTNEAIWVIFLQGQMLEQRRVLL